MSLIVMIAVGVCIFMFSVYFTRWVFGIDQIIQNQKEQTNWLKSISENIQKMTNLDIEHRNNSKIINPEKVSQSSKIMGNSNFCPACGNQVQDKECSSCGLVIR